MEARHQLVLRLRQIERQPARLGDAGNGKGDESEDLRNTKPQVFLRRDDIAQIERTGQHDHTHQREPHEDLVAQHLCCRPEPSQQRVFIIRGPSAQNNAVNPQRGHGEEK